MTFLELLEEYDIPCAPDGHHHQTLGWTQIDCPFCGRDSGRFHMGYHLTSGVVNCWRCGTHSIISVLREYTGLPYTKLKQAIEQLDDVRIRQPVKKENIRGLLSIPSCTGPLKDPHIRYLSKRGFHYKDIQQLWQVQGIGIAGRLSWRLFIPILHKGRIVSWTTRSLGEDGLRYISAESDQELIPHKHILYGGDYVRNAAIVVEGPLDVWRIGPGAVGTFGTAFTQQQLLQLVNIPRRIVCFDNDPEAQRQAKKLCRELGAFPGETLNVVLDDKDPADSKGSEIKELRKFLK
jgi:DNA primase